jgi:aromatic-L-amino-acid decarboxylase
MIPAKLRQIFVIRMAICSRYTETSDVDNSWNEIRQQTDVFLTEKTASE